MPSDLDILLMSATHVLSFREPRPTTFLQADSPNSWHLRATGPSVHKTPELISDEAKAISMDVGNDTGSTSDTIEIPPKPDQFVKRGEGHYVPLIALDNLPDFIKIDGLARAFSHAEFQAMNGKTVFDGNAGARYLVRVDSESQSPEPVTEPPRPVDESVHVSTAFLLIQSSSSGLIRSGHSHRQPAQKQHDPPSRDRPEV